MSQPESLNKAVYKINEVNHRLLLDKIQRCQKDITECRNKYDKEIFEIERKYLKHVFPYLRERSTHIEKIPGFWSKVVLHHPLMTAVFEPGEKDIFKYLIDIDVEDDPDNPDYFKIHFFFEPNPYFENRVLTKQFTEDGSASTTINWKTDNVFPKDSKHEVWEYDELGLELKGFFRWFSDPEEQFCDPIADIFKCHIWHDPMEFYFMDTSEERRKGSEEFPFR